MIRSVTRESKVERQKSKVPDPDPKLFDFRLSTLDSPPYAALTRLRRFLPLLIFLVATVALADEVFRDTFRSTTWGVELVVPTDWRLSAQQSYPSILLYASHKARGGRMTLAVQRLTAPETARAFAERSAAALRKLGFTILSTSPHRLGAVLVDSATPDKATRVKQAYFVENGAGYVLTMSVPLAQIRFYQRAFDDTIRSIVFRVPTFVNPLEVPDAGPAELLPDAAPPDAGATP